MIFLNPNKTDFSTLDPRSKEIMEKTVAFFENKGRGKLKADDRERVWYADFIEFLKKEKVFATLLTQKGYGPEDYRWDSYRNMMFSEILGFYGLHYWYVWQVTILGLGPIWMSDNERVKKQTAEYLENGEIFGFGLSEKEHGADIRSNTMTLTKQPDGTYLANGRKYYIGNGNKAAYISTQGKIAETGEFVFFVVDSKNKKYECIKNTVNAQSYVAEYGLTDYVIKEEDILGKGRTAWDLALSTVNVGKYNLGWASVGMCTHAFYEAITHAANRRIFAQHVTDFPHIKQLFSDAYYRLTAMKLFSARTADYMRTASNEDKRYLLFDPIVKMYVTLQGEEVINELWDVIAAKGFEKDMFFEMAARDIRALPKLEGTVHVNMILIIRFIQNYLLEPAGGLPEIPTVSEPKNDDFLFNQGSSQKGLNKLKFHNYEDTYNQFSFPNIEVFKTQVNALKTFMRESEPSKEQKRDIDYMLVLGKLFTQVVYGHLILEKAKLLNVSEDILDGIFDFIVRDFSVNALEMYSKTSSTPAQMENCLKMIKKPDTDLDRFKRVYEEQIYPLKDAYIMND